VDAIEAALAKTGYSRFPLVNAAGQFVGFVHIKDVLDQIEVPDAIVAGALIRPLPQLPAAMPLPDALSRLRRTNSHLALVTDADGTVCALVALEDLVEDLVGAVRDRMHRD
jgi:CBS domain containing-hemolysin-like protein